MRNKHLHRYNSQFAAQTLLEQILAQTFISADTRHIDSLVSSHLPQHYLKYIQNVSVIMYTHREPKTFNPHHKMLTEPAQSYSHQLHNLSRIQGFSHEASTPTKLLKLTNKMISRKQSICLSVRSKKSLHEDMQSRKYISRRKIAAPEPIKLIPLQQYEKTSGKDSRECEEKIAQLRQRKIKLEEAMKMFKEEDRKIKQIQFKKNKENTQLFTTDFRGKMINFVNRKSKPKLTETSKALTFRVHTVVEGGRPWRKGGMSPRRNVQKQEHDRVIID